MLRWRSVAIATTPGTLGSDVTTRVRIASAAALKSSAILFLPCLLTSVEPLSQARAATLTRCDRSQSAPSTDHHRRSAHRETFVVLGRGLVALLPIGPD